MSSKNFSANIMLKNILPRAPAPFATFQTEETFFDNISQMKPEDWKPDTLDAIATGSADGKRIVIKAVNYERHHNTLLTRLQGATVPANATVKPTR